MAQPFGTNTAIIVITICLIITTIISLRLWYQLSNQTSQTQKLTVMLIKLCVITSTLCIYCDETRYIICAIWNQSEVFYPMNQIMSLADLFYYIGGVSFYSLAIYRLYISFYDTIYSIRPCVIKFFITLIIIQALGAAYYCIIVALQPGNETDKNINNFFLKYTTISTIIMMTNDFILNLSLLCLFVAKLKESLTDTLVSSSIKQIGSTTDTLSQNMVDLITRHLILFGVAIITNQLFLGSDIIVFSNIGLSKFKYHFIIFICRSIENMANCVVLFLGLKHNWKLYTKICGKCHLWLAGCCMKSTQKKVDLRRSEAQACHYHRMYDPNEAELAPSI